MFCFVFEAKSKTGHICISESLITRWITHDSQTWKSNTLTHELLSNFFQDKHKAKSQQPFKIRKYCPDEVVHILCVSGLPPKPQWPKYNSRNINLEVWPSLSKWSHLLFIKSVFQANLHFSCNHIWFESTDVPIFSLRSICLKPEETAQPCQDIHAR